MKENWYAFLICIIRKDYNIDRSLQVMIDGISTKVQNTSIDKADVKDMIQMKQQGMTHKAIGEVYGLSEEATYRRIKRYKEKRLVAV